MRVVLDANILISAIISRKGSPAQILVLWEQEMFDLIISPPVLAELERVIHYPRIRKRYNLPEEQVDQFIQLISTQAISVDPSIEITVIEKDLTDNRYLECAVAGGASYIITGDSHLLELKEYKGIIILPPTGFLVLVESEKKKKL